MGGMKDSGVGSRHGEHGLLKSTDTQTIATERLLPVGIPRGINAALYAKTMTRALRWLRKAPGVK